MPRVVAITNVALGLVSGRENSKPARVRTLVSPVCGRVHVGGGCGRPGTVGLLRRAITLGGQATRPALKRDVALNRINSMGSEQ